MKEILSAFQESSDDRTAKVVINGITFYYDDSFKLTDEITDYLKAFTADADDDCYTVYLDGGKLAVY